MLYRRELVVLAFVAACAGCSAAAPLPAWEAPAVPAGIEGAKKKPFETLKAAHVSVTVQSCISGSGEATFTASGKAKGHYRGTFTVKGAWNFVNTGGQSFWTFAETFEIKGKHPITGTIEGSETDPIATCKTFGPVGGGKDLPYHLGKKTGFATSTELKNGAAMLQRLR